MYEIYAFNAATSEIYTSFVENEHEAWEKYYGMRFMAYNSGSYVSIQKLDENGCTILEYYDDAEEE